MATMIFRPTDYSFPNLTIESGWKVENETETHINYRLTANDGYVFYDINANDTEIDPETMEERPVTYYYTIAYLPLNCNFNNFHYVAVPRDSVDENYIFGGGNNNDHEVM